MKQRADSEQVSPTAYGTSWFWYRHGLAPEGLLAPESRKVGRRFDWLMRAIRAATGLSIADLMLARHKGIDARLAALIESGQVSQVVELAAGLSARGWRMTRRFGERIEYVETDLPRMAQLKQGLLEKGLFGPRHRVAVVDVLRAGGSGSLEALASTLDREQGLAIITEGLMTYLDPPSANDLWGRIAGTLRGFRNGVYLSDAYLRDDGYGVGGAAFRAVIQRFVRGRMHIHFETAGEATRLLGGTGFGTVVLHEPGNIPETREHARVKGGSRVRILEATATQA